MRSFCVRNVVSVLSDMFSTDFDSSQTKIGLSAFSLRNAMQQP